MVQDTGSESFDNRNQAFSQTALLYVLISLLFVSGGMLFGGPELGVIGVGGATLVAQFVLFVSLVSYVHLTTLVTYERPRKLSIGKQLVEIGIP